MGVTEPVVAADAPIEGLERWFAERGWSPFAFQREVWAAYREGESGLIHSASVLPEPVAE